MKLLAAAGGAMLLPTGMTLEAQAVGSKEERLASRHISLEAAKYAVEPAFTQLRFGAIKPTGWILAQMRRDLKEGFAGHLDELCQEASSDIFASGRNRPGKTNNGNVANDSWWNGESEGNWRSGQMMQACLTNDPAAMSKADAYVDHILATQDEDGYIGIFQPELRYSGNGEFWTQVCLFRGVLAYAEATGKTKVFDAVQRAVDRTIEGYANGKSFHFSQHDAMYCDVLEALYDRTGEKKYLNFALRIYQERENLREFHRQPLVGGAFQRCYHEGHGPTAVESMRMPFWFWTATGETEYLKTGLRLMSAMDAFTMPSGALVSEESVDAPPHPWNVGYEYCAIFERQSSLINAGQKTGDARFFDQTEHLWFNAAQGSREPDGTAILYCSCENRLSVHDEIGKRQRFSPTHQQVAVCCVPNAVRVAPDFISKAWMKPRGKEPALAATLYGPCEVNTQIAGVAIRIEEKTNYPYSGDVEIIVRPSNPIAFCLWLRNPEWSKETKISIRGADIRRVGSFWQVRKEWKDGDRISIRFDQAIRAVPALDNEFALQYGPLLYVLPIRGEVQYIRTYPESDLKDYFVTRANNQDAEFAFPMKKGIAGFGFKVKKMPDTNPDYPLDKPATVLTGQLIKKDGTEESVDLEPIGSRDTRLRRVTFPIAG
jgi:hypothetical protein